MLIRCRGYNSGVKEYLEEGLKSGRELTRNELDERVILDGNLELTDMIYKSIKDKGQDRYLTFTLAFKEDEIEQDKLTAITQEFKSFLMSAYDTDEYNFYAEAHLPKVKTMVDKKTGKLVDRKPHIHIVIPRKNLLTGNEMNPVGKYEENEKYIEAFQEYINQKYSLESPRDNMRLTPTNYADILSRYKGDDFRAKNREFKHSLLERVLNDGISSRQGFYDLVSEYGETKIRNAGKPSEYIAVKLNGDSKFTNLKESIFSDEFIIHRKMSKAPLEKHVIRDRFSEWKQRSEEIKYIDKIASPKYRKLYYASDPVARSKMVSELSKQFYEKYRGYHELPGQRQRNNKQRTSESQRGFNTPSSDRLQNVSSGYVAGTRSRKGNKVLLPSDARLHLADQQTDGNSGLRRTVRGTGRRRDGVPSQSERQSGDASTGRKSIRSGLGRSIRGRTKLQLTPYPVLPRLKNRIPTLDDIHRRGGFLFNAGTIADGTRKTKPVFSQSSFPNNSTNTSSVPGWLFRRIKEADFPQKNINKLLRGIDREFYDIRREVIADKRFTYDEKNQLISVMLFERIKRKDAIVNKSEDCTMGSKDIRDMINNRQNNSSFTISAPEPEKERPAQGRFAQVMDRLRNPVNYSKVADESRKSVEKHLDASNLYTKRTRKGHIHYLDKSSDKTLFVDNGKLITMRKNGLSNDSVAVALELAQGRFGSTLNIKGSKEFKDMVVNVVAEKGLDIHFTDKKMNQALAQRRLEMEQAKAGKDAKSVDGAFTIEGAETGREAAQAVSSTRQPNQTVEEVKAILLNPALRRLAMSDDQKRYEFSEAAAGRENEARAQINSEIIKARSGVDIEPSALIQDVIDAHKATLQGSVPQPKPQQTVEEVKTMLLNPELRRIAMSDDQKRREFSGAAAGKENEVRAEINAEIIKARTGVDIEPSTLTQDVINAHTATLPKVTTERTGKIVKHGAAPYLNKEGSSPSYYVTLRDKDGQESTLWGVGLKNALNGFKRGHEISLTLKESLPVQVKVRDEKGHESIVDATRNVWEATRLDGPQPKKAEQSNEDVTKGFKLVNFDSHSPDLA